jgi:hypothetical protein
MQYFMPIYESEADLDGRGKEMKEGEIQERLDGRSRSETSECLIHRWSLK